MNFRNKQRTLNVPSPSKAMKRPQVLEAEKFTQFGQARRFAAHCENLGAPSVARLDDGARPTNISYDVSKVVVDSVKFMCRRAFSKVFQKRLEGLLPTLANGNALGTVVIVFVALWICASLKHVVISPIGSGLVPPSGVSVDGNAFDRKVARTTGSCAAALKAGVSYQFFGSAFTSAKALTEHGSAWASVRWSVRDYCELAECSSDEGFSLGHNDGSFIVVSSGGSRLQPILAAFSTVNEGGSNA